MEIVFSLVLAMSGERLYNNSELFNDVYKGKGEKTNSKKEHSTTMEEIYLKTQNKKPNVLQKHVITSHRNGNTIINHDFIAK